MQRKEIRSGSIKCTVLAPNSTNEYTFKLHILQSKYIQYVRVRINVQLKSFSYYNFTWSVVTWGCIGETACPCDWFVTSVITISLAVALHCHCNTWHSPRLTGKPSCGTGLSNTFIAIMITETLTLCLWIHFKESYKIRKHTVSLSKNMRIIQNNN